MAGKLKRPSNAARKKRTKRITPKGERKEETAQEYLARLACEGSEFSSASQENDAREQRNRRAILKSVYGQELLRSSAGQEAVELLEEILRGMSTAATYHMTATSLSGERSKVFGELLEALGSEDEKLLNAKLHSPVPHERAVFGLCRALKLLLGAVNGGPADFFENFAQACAKRRNPRNPRRHAIVWLLEFKRQSDWIVYLQKSETSTPEEGGEWNVHTLFAAFKFILAIKPKNDREEKSAYSSFMITLKALEDEKMVSRVPRTKTGKKAKGGN